MTRANKPKVNRAGDPSVSSPMDRCQTPRYALRPLLPYLPLSSLIWEPAAGKGLLVASLSESHQVVASDILYGQDFFRYQPETWDCLVTNPPYSIKYRWIGRCYELGKPWALLMPVEALGAKQAQVLFRKHGMELIVMDQRVNFEMPNKGLSGSGAQFPVAWFTHGLNIGRDITYASFATVCQLELL